MTARGVARAIDALRRGWPVEIGGAEGALLVLPVETASPASIVPGSDVLISAQRAATLKLTNQLDAASGTPVRVAHVPWLDAHTLADPVLDLASPLKGPFRTRAVATPDAAIAAIRLARLAGLLPAFHIGTRDPEIERVQAVDVMMFDSESSVSISARARLPIKGAEHCEIVAFRSDGNDPVALVIGAPNGAPPLVRLHSECLTGDALGSLKCDCGPQLDAAMARIAAEGWGMLLYLRQEGRGIGLVNKLRAYQLQDQGFDTVDANLRLGFEDDARDFTIAAAMLMLLGQDQIRLLTNNPKKVAALETAGISVTARLAHEAGRGPDNVAYLATKRDRSGHLL